jgi:hypothetical protein
MVTMRLTTEEAPSVGHGRWVWPAHIIRDKQLTEFIHEEGLKLQDELAEMVPREIEGQWNPNHNAQTLWAAFKLRIGQKARERAKIIVPPIKQEMKMIKTKMDLIAADRDLSEEEQSSFQLELKFKQKLFISVRLKFGRRTSGRSSADRPQTIRCSSADGLRLMCRRLALTSFIGATTGDLQVGPLLKFCRVSNLCVLGRYLIYYQV